MSKLVDRTCAFLEGEDVRYVFTGVVAINPALAPVVFFFDFIQVPVMGARQFRIVAVTETEIVVMKGGNWTARSRRTPKRLLYRLPRQTIGPLKDWSRSVIELGEERIRVRPSTYRVIKRANAEFARQGVWS